MKKLHIRDRSLPFRIGQSEVLQVIEVVVQEKLPVFERGLIAETFRYVLL